jgi:transposase
LTSPVTISLLLHPWTLCCHVVDGQRRPRSTGDGYTHGAVKHAAKEWSWYDWRTGETFHTNSVEGFWRLFKASVRSTHIHISEKRMPAYLAEFCYRSNHRQFGNVMFDLLISRV